MLRRMESDDLFLFLFQLYLSSFLFKELLFKEMF